MGWQKSILPTSPHLHPFIYEVKIWTKLSILFLFLNITAILFPKIPVALFPVLSISCQAIILSNHYTSNWFLRRCCATCSYSCFKVYYKSHFWYAVKKYCQLRKKQGNHHNSETGGNRNRVEIWSVECKVVSAVRITCSIL